MIERRRFLIGLGALFAAPAIVRAASLMPVRGIVMSKYPVPYWPATALPAGQWIAINYVTMPNELFDEIPYLTSATLRASSGARSAGP